MNKDIFKVVWIFASAIFMIWGLLQLNFFDTKLLLIWLSAANCGITAGYCNKWIKEIDAANGNLPK